MADISGSEADLEPVAHASYLCPGWPAGFDLALEHASVTQPFCRSCTRARLSAEGKLYTCLFAGSGHDLRATLRNGVSDQALRERVTAIWTMRSDRYSDLRTRATGRTQKVEMSRIGG